MSYPRYHLCMMAAVADLDSKTARPGRSDTREVVELRALKERQPELTDAVDMHIELLELQRRIQGRLPLPMLELGPDTVVQHQAAATPLLRFEDIRLELTDLRLMVRQTADVLRRHGALDEDDFQRSELLGRDMTLLTAAATWFRARAERTPHRPGAVLAVDTADGGMLDQVLALAMRPFLSRCAEVLQRHASLSQWTHPHCALCGGEPDFAVITQAAERHLVCSRCTLRWKFQPLTCPYCLNDDRRRITSFATPDGRYRVYACDACLRYLKAYDSRRATRPLMVTVDAVATLPLDAAAMQRGYAS